MDWDKMRAWVPIAIALLSLLAGGGWLQFALARRREKQKDFQTLLESFLLPLKRSLGRNKERFERMVRGHEQEVSQLEYFPDRLKPYFDSLPDTDLRKTFWKLEIQELQAENDQAIGIVHKHSNSILLSDALKRACDEFCQHAIDWKARWNYALSLGTIAEGAKQQLIAQPFPGDLEDLLAKETARVKDLAKIKSHLDSVGRNID
jgi:hypothetical protein